MAKSKKRSVFKSEHKLSPAMLRAHAEEAEKLLMQETEAEEEDAAAETADAEENMEIEPDTAETSDGKDTEKEEVYKILRRLMDDMGADSLSALSAMIDRAETEKLISGHGLDEKSARLFLMQQEKLRTLREAEALARREAIYAAMRKDPLYEDVDSRRDAIEALILRTGLSPKEAYNALFAEVRLSKLLEEAEKEGLRAVKKSRRIPALSGGNAPDSDVGTALSALESWAADKAGMTKEEYAKYKFNF